MKVEVGQQVPSFSRENENGQIVSSESLLGQKYVLFFYPMDNTPGCTKEACSIRDHYQEIRDAGYDTFGVSPDSAKKHQNFIKKFDFPFSLLVDDDKSMLKAFGLYGPKKFMGKSLIGVYRTTVIVDEKGVISHVIEKVKTKEHGQQILDLIS